MTRLGPTLPLPAATPPPISTSATPTGAGRIPEIDSPAPVRGAAPEAPTGNVLIARIGTTADLAAAAAMPRGPERKQAVYDALVETAKTSQVAALAALEGLQKSGDVTAVESLYMPNAILVTTKAGRHQAVSDALAGVANVQAVAENRTWSVQGALDEVSVGTAGAAAGASLLAYARRFIDGPAFMDPNAGRRAVADFEAIDPVAPSAEWGVGKISAPEAWAKGIDGTGVTVGIVDTGLDAEHPAIKPHYRGTKADGSVVHDYNWYDPFGQRPVAFDDGDHGTHVAGTTAGGTGDRAIGVAPGAKIIAAKAINGRGYNTTAATLKALQFMLAPTKTDGSAPDPTKGADVVNNSWGNADQADETFVDTFKSLKAAGIEVVSAAGNSGPREGTVSPPGSYPGYLSVAATTNRDTVAGFSSRGPSRFATPQDMTPNVAAPGAGVTSAVPGGRYQSMSGTSMASPHVAGAVALLLQAAPQATHEQIVTALTKTAVDIDKPGPDNAAGFGRIDVVKALEHLKAATSGEAVSDASVDAPVEAAEQAA
jgi:bacillopeptidase F